MPKASPTERFLAKIVVDDNGCHLWQSTIKRDGYGQFWMDGAARKAHHAAYELFVGPISAGRWVLHRCDVKHCVNPDHLYLGTPKQNSRDRDERGRANHAVKFSDSEIQAVYSLKDSGCTQMSVAEEFGIDQTYVSELWRGLKRQDCILQT